MLRRAPRALASLACGPRARATPWRVCQVRGLELLQYVHALSEPLLLIGFHRRPFHPFQASELGLGRVGPFSLHLFNVSEFLLVTPIGVGDIALGQHVVFDVLLELVKRTAAVV
mmetsp:Transcript_6673/g.17451  ORF Transcript_6673/g.17451 Transcript_6673/m.17451 type:complete len:114 (-) Transcript_6673:339-680(-)